MGELIPLPRVAMPTLAQPSEPKPEPVKQPDLKIVADLAQQQHNLKQMREMMEAIGVVLAPKALLLIAMVGAFVLTIFALIFPDWQHLLAAVSFDVLVFLPTVYLYLKG